ncbi:hypothetical protein GCM10007886_46670 [Methylobacterium gregans]|uniref:histidine kinase n=1 Tax=Methylobacterium gregans TaxID=374424 RepID=A0AA37HU71_9HYPH|nr:ATP-binding protein [Methylobacterium gregans]MDQ0518761.1 signal transduction histidine kinase [Methylobacterium gregans]GJD81725.1 Sensor histidine kinase RcsC [Methylobacterium gregans]GLS56482.1 hypothetical protein GCM10007886_46670 [Methylobacterium gregans]
MAGGAGLNDRESSGSGAASAPEDAGLGAVWDDASPTDGDIRFVLAEDAAQVVYAWPGARPLLRALAPAGVLPAALARQIRPAGGPGVRMLRLRLDPRGLAPPTLCRTVPGRAADGRRLILLAVVGKLPALRAGFPPIPTPDETSSDVAAERPAGPPAEPPVEDHAPAAAPETAEPADREPAAPRPGGRFVWRSDAAGALTQLSGGGDALARLIGVTWAELTASGRLRQGEVFLDALAQRRTFRGLGAVLTLEGGVSVAADLSGAPLGRPGQAFQGYGGFGIVRGVTLEDPAPPAAGMVPAPEATGTGADTPEPREGDTGSREGTGAAQMPDPAVASPAPAVAAASGVPVPRGPGPVAPPYPLAPPFGRGLGADPVAMATMAAPLLAAWLQQDWFGPPARTAPARPAAQAPASGSEPPPTIAPVAAPDVVPEPEGGPEQDVAPEHAPEPGLAAEPDHLPEPDHLLEPEAAPAALSVSEHDAFREIARALGVRYAGDPADDADEAVPADPGGRGAVMPFSFASPSASVRTEPEPAALLDGVPGPLLLHRGPEILAANRAFLDLADYPDLAALRAAGLTRLFPDPLPDPLPEDATRALETRDGTVRRVALARGAMPWPGGPAAALLLRPLADAEAGSGAASGVEARPPVAALPGRDADATAAALRAALDAVAEGVVVADAAGRVLSLNRAAADLLGRDPRAAPGAALRDLVPPEMAGALAEADGCPVSFEGGALAVRSAALGGGLRALLLRPVPEPVRSEGPGFVARFLAQLDREIRTPLTGILGFADVMLKEPYGPLGHARYRSYLNDIRASGEQVLALVADLVDLATVETGGLPLSRRPLPLNDLVSTCVAEMQAEAARGRIVLRTSFAEDLAPLEADEPSLARAARLVIGNAIRLTGAGGQVIVSTNPAERGAVALRVRDTGIGMSPEEIAFALEPFRGGRPEAGGPDGAHAAAGGLGLPLSRALVEANDGRLSISSRKDEGTLVEILLPGRAARRA